MLESRKYEFDKQIVFLLFQIKQKINSHFLLSHIEIMLGHLLLQNMIIY